MAYRVRSKLSPAQREAKRLHENRIKLYQEMLSRGDTITRKDLEEWEDLAADDPSHPMAIAIFVACQECRSIMRQRGSRQRMEMELANERNREISVKMGGISGWS